MLNLQYEASKSSNLGDTFGIAVRDVGESLVETSCDKLMIFLPSRRDLD